jgi:hypothetical protein
MTNRFYVEGKEVAILEEISNKNQNNQRESPLLSPYTLISTCHSER